MGSAGCEDVSRQPTDDKPVNEEVSQVTGHGAGFQRPCSLCHPVWISLVQPQKDENVARRRRRTKARDETKDPWHGREELRGRRKDGLDTTLEENMADWLADRQVFGLIRR